MDENETNGTANRNFDPRSKEYQSEGQGKIIKSLRTFGVEIEMVNESSDRVRTLQKSIGRMFGMHNDGSIDAHEGYGIEVVSPIMKGERGENGILEMFGKINKHGFSVNKSCGLHVHVDGEGFSKKQKVKVVKISEANSSMIKDSKRDDYAFVVSKRVMSMIGKKCHIDRPRTAELIADEYLGSGSVFLSKILEQNIPEIEQQSSVLDIENFRIMLDYFDFTDDKKIDDYNELEINKLTPNSDDYLCIVYENRNLNNLLTLLYLHVVFGDVFLAMLPKSRRQDNLYCEPLDVAFSPQQIESISSFTELEQAWYKTKNISDTIRHKGNNYDDSRYFTINLHSLFAKYGTIEYRAHSATLDPNKVLYWAALNQEIMDKIVEGEVTIDDLRRGVHLRDTDAKLEHLLKVLRLRAPLVKYINQRIEYFKSKDK